MTIGRDVKGSGPVMMRDNLLQATDMRKTMAELSRVGREQNTDQKRIYLSTYTIINSILVQSTLV